MFLGIINYLGKCVPSSGNVCEPLQKLTSSKTYGHGMHHTKLFDKAKLLIKDYV